MSVTKTSAKSKFVPADLDDFINESHFLKKSPKGKKIIKRQRPEYVEESNSRPVNINGSKKKKMDENGEVCRESRQKLLNVMSHQIETRKQTNENLMKSLSEVITHLEADYNILQDNEQKLEHLTGAIIKCIQQATNAHKQKLKALKEIQTSFKKETEGLLTRGAMKPNDRPLWFDVYKAFPPNTEPKFAKPKPEAKPIRQILYKEDVIRAKFHTKGYGLGVNMLNSSGETQTKRLIQQYEKLQLEGVSDNELIEKSVAAVSAEGQIATKIPPKNRDSVTSHMITDANIVNIFKE